MRENDYAPLPSLFLPPPSPGGTIWSGPWGIQNRQHLPSAFRDPVACAPQRCYRPASDPVNLGGRQMA